MHDSLPLQVLGYAASALVAVSLMMKSLVRLRLINLAGASLMSAYGLFIHAYPVAVLNGVIVLVDLFYLQQMWRARDYFKLLEVAHDSEYVRGFVQFHRDGIADFVPGYVHAEADTHRHVLVLRNMVPAGLLVLRPEGRAGRVLLDFVIPGYRDFGVGRFLFEDNAAYFLERGMLRLVSAAGRPRHAAYLERMGFRREGDEYVRDLAAGPAAARAGAAAPA